MLKLGVNVDHVATLRQVRGVTYPSPLEAAKICMKAGASGITAHLREDRRHIQDRDIEQIAAATGKLNMEMAVTDEMVSIASRVKPVFCCLVPEKRQELTTEGGLDVIARSETIRNAVAKLSSCGIQVSLFIDPENAQIEEAKRIGAPLIELHTGAYANAQGEAKKQELDRLRSAAEFAHSIGLTVNAGHGIDYENIVPLVREVPYLNELNIGHSIICRAVFTGLENAVRELLGKMNG